VQTMKCYPMTWWWKKSRKNTSSPDGNQVDNTCLTIFWGRNWFYLEKWNTQSY